MELTTIQLTELDAKAFIQFQKYHAFMILLENIGAFDMKNANLNIHFDSNGKIVKVSKQEFFIP